MEPKVFQKFVASFDKRNTFVQISMVNVREPLTKIGFNAIKKGSVHVQKKCNICGIISAVKEVQLKFKTLKDCFSITSSNPPKPSALCLSCASVIRKMKNIYKENRKEFNDFALGIKAVLQIRQRQEELQECTTTVLKDVGNAAQNVIIKVERNTDEVICPDLDIDENYMLPFPWKLDLEEPAVCGLEGVEQPLLGKTRMSKRKVNCGYCGRVSSNLYNLRHHIKIVHEKKGLFRCYFCSQHLTSRSGLQQHMLGQHLRELPYACEAKDCRFRTANSGYWMSHLKERHYQLWIEEQKLKVKPTEYKCLYCPKTFKGKENLRRHHKTHGKRMMYPCNLCAKSYFKSASLKEHLIAEHGEKGPSFPCPHEGCNRPPFPSRARLNNHIKVTHDNESATCEHCRATFRNQVAMRDHQSRSKICAQISGRSLRLIPCPHPGCGKSFVENGILKNHITAVHDSAEAKLTRKCQLCGAAFQWRKQLGKHMVQEHGGLPCGLCDKKLDNHNSLAAHRKRVHYVGKEKREFKCEQEGCKKTFLFNYELLQHVKLSHEKLGVFCYFCEEKFFHKFNLYQHIMGQHLRERPWSCEVSGCGFSTAMKGYWRTHMKDKHPKVSQSRKV